MFTVCRLLFVSAINQVMNPQRMLFHLKRVGTKLQVPKSNITYLHWFQTMTLAPWKFSHFCTLHIVKDVVTWSIISSICLVIHSSIRLVIHVNRHPGSSKITGGTPSLYWVWHCSFLPTKNGKEIYPSCNALQASYFPNAQLGQWNGLQVMASENFYL